MGVIGGKGRADLVIRNDREIDQKTEDPGAKKVPKAHRGQEHDCPEVRERSLRLCSLLSTQLEKTPGFPTLPQIACFDTAFHVTQPAVAQAFALPRRLTAEGVRRYGFHGLSYEYIASVLPALRPELAGARVVVAHLGNGASMCALRDGRSVATTMSFTALDGLVMGTRCGDLDPGVLLYMMRRHGMDLPALEQLLYEQSGLLGVSG